MSSTDDERSCAGGRVVDVEAADLDRELAVARRADVDVGLAEDHEQVAGAGLLEQLVAHREVGVHARLEDRQAAERRGLLPRQRVEGEAADDEQVGELDGLLGGVADELRADGAELGADRDRDGPGLPALDVLPDSLDEDARVRVEAAELEALVALGVLDAGPAEVVEDARRRSAPASTDGVGSAAAASSGPSTRTRWGDRLSTVNGPDTRTILRSSYGRSNRVSVSAWRAIAASISSRRHALADVGVLGDRLQGHVRHALVDEAAADVVAVGGIGLGGAWPVSSASLRMPASESARR